MERTGAQSDHHSEGYGAFLDEEDATGPSAPDLSALLLSRASERPLATQRFRGLLREFELDADVIALSRDIDGEGDDLDIDIDTQVRRSPPLAPTGTRAQPALTSASTGPLDFLQNLASLIRNLPLHILLDCHADEIPPELALHASVRPPPAIPLHPAPPGPSDPPTADPKRTPNRTAPPTVGALRATPPLASTLATAPARIPPPEPPGPSPTATAVASFVADVDALLSDLDLSTPSASRSAPPRRSAPPAVDDVDALLADLSSSGVASARRAPPPRDLDDLLSGL